MVRRQAEGAAQRVGELPAAGIPAGWFLGQRTGEDAIGRGRAPARLPVSGGGGSDRWAYIIARTSSRGNTAMPDSNSNAVHASAY